jgi:glycosyltransferase involved in cell wall biosynthesis
MCCLNGIKNSDFIQKKMQSKKKLYFILPSLKAGGAERVISFVATNLDRQKYDVKLVVVGFEKDAVYDTNSIDVLYLNKSRLSHSFFKVYTILKTEKPDIVIGSIGHVNLLLGFFSVFFKKIKFIAREASVVSEMYKFSEKKGIITFKLIKLLYPRLTAIICQSDDMKNDFQNVFNINTAKLFKINNPITQIEFTHVEHSFNPSILKFITVGRLSYEKGYIRILEGLSQIKKYDFHYTILGSGNLKETIINKIIELNLKDKVTIIPISTNVLDLLSTHDYFIQGSFVEGFPNALLESCSVGVPVIAFNAPGGTKEIVVNKVNGFIVNDEVSFVTILNSLNSVSFDKLKIKETVQNKFNPQIILEKYEQLFDLV